MVSRARVRLRVTEGRDSDPRAPPTTLRLDARDNPARERADAVRHAIASTIVHVEIDFPQPGAQVTDSGVIADLGALTVCSIHSNATVVQRTRRLAGDDLEPCIFLGLQHSGSSLVAQGGARWCSARATW